MPSAVYRIMLTYDLHLLEKASALIATSWVLIFPHVLFVTLIVPTKHTRHLAYFLPYPISYFVE